MPIAYRCDTLIAKRVRGADGAADWIILPSGYDPEVVTGGRLEPAFRVFAHRMGIQGNAIMGRYRLALTMTPEDILAAIQN